MTNLVLIGSKALSMRTDLDWRKYGTDYDVVGTYDDIVAFMKKTPLRSLVPASGGKKLIARPVNGPIIEGEITWQGSSAEVLYDAVLNDPQTDEFNGMYVPSASFLYALKMSHRFLKNSPHFLKTRQDIMYMRERFGFNPHIPPNHMTFYERRVKATYDYAHPKLNVNKTQFFNDDVGYVYDHDTIHDAVKIMDWPAYQNFKDDQAEVFCSKTKFWECDESVRLNAVIEEAMVLAIERSLVPHPGVMTSDEAFEYALRKVCTSITSGWFRDYAWENYDKAMDLYPRRYDKKFWNAVLSGIVRPHKETA